MNLELWKRGGRTACKSKGVDKMDFYCFKSVYRIDILCFMFNILGLDYTV